METFKEALENAKIKAVNTIAEKLKSDISNVDLVNLCACLNNFKTDEYFVSQFLRAKQFIDGEKTEKPEEATEKVEE